MFLLPQLAYAEDVSLDLTVDQQHWSMTFNDVHPGRLPGLTLTGGPREIRVDLDVKAVAPDQLTIAYNIAEVETTGAPGHLLWTGVLAGGGTALPTFMAGGADHSIQMITATSHPSSDVAGGPLSGCQFARYSGMTDVVCPSASLRHHRVEAIAFDEIEAGVNRARANPALKVDAGPVTLRIAGQEVKGYRVNVKSAGSAPSMNLMAWLGADGKDEVRCVGAEEVFLKYMEAFAGGLPAELR